MRAYLREKYRNKKIGVIVVHGVRALEIFLRFRSELWPDTPVVTSFIDEATADRLKPVADVTGSFAQLHFGNAVSAARAIVPNLKRLALVGDPYGRQPFRQHYVKEMRSIRNDLEIIDFSGLPLREVEKRVAVLPNDAAIFYTGIYRDTEGSIYIPGELITQVAKTANRPIVTDNEALVGAGATGGFVASNVRMAENAALLVRRILSGERAGNIPITGGESVHPVSDRRQMQRFGISESTLPPGAEIRFRPPGIWEQYRWQMVAIFAAVILQAGVIFGLLVERRRRQFAEQESRLRLRELVHLNRTATAGALSASIAHELNQPLGAILCNAEAAEVLLGNEFPDLAQVRDILADIRRDDERAGDVIRHLRGLLKKREIELQDFELGNTIQATLNILQPEAIRRGVGSISEPLQSSVPVRADQVQLQQVILNLLTNGMDAMETCAPGKRILVVESSLTGTSEVEISILDTGTGIPTDKLEGIFDTFFTTKPQGTGLGLSIARTIVESNGARSGPKIAPPAALRFGSRCRWRSRT